MRPVEVPARDGVLGLHDVRERGHRRQVGLAHRVERLAQLPAAQPLLLVEHADLPGEDDELGVHDALVLGVAGLGGDGRFGGDGHGTPRVLGSSVHSLRSGDPVPSDLRPISGRGRTTAT